MKKEKLTKLVFEGDIFEIDFLVTKTGQVPAEEYLESLLESSQEKLAALFVWLGDHGKIWNEQKFKHLTGSEQIFEFKSGSDRVFCFFFFGKRVILTHGFKKKGKKTPKGEIEKAESYKHDFERRIKNEK